jgi:hypothetical protein
MEENIPQFCKNDPRHMLTRVRLKMELPSDEYDKRIKRYINDCKICRNDANCLEQANTNLGRNKTTYPWPNYDWDYANYVDNNYSAKATGSGPNVGVFKNLGTSIKIAKGFITEPNPGKKSTPSGNNPYDNQGDFPIYGCEGNQSEGCQKWWKVRKNADLGKPYDDGFFNNYGTNGLKSSSYYVKVGTCARKSITNEEECKKRGYNWQFGACFQDRYAYMDNEGGVGSFKGLIPSVTTDILAFNPLYISGLLVGFDNPYMKLQECPEGFTNTNKDNSNIWIGLLIGLILIGCSKKLIKK